MTTNIIPFPTPAPPGLSVQSDEDLMEACAGGSDDAFRVLVDRYSAKIVGLITRVINDRHRAEDLAQDVFVRVHRHRRTYRRVGKFYTWLYTIALNIARNELRSMKRRGSSVPIDPVTGTNESGTLHLPNEDDVPADRQMQQHDTARLVHRAIDDLPPIHREILILRDIRGLSYEEVGDVLAIPGGTVRSRVNRARLALRKRLCELVPELAERESGLDLDAIGL